MAMSQLRVVKRKSWKIEDENASMVINAEDKVLSPGFIDAHSMLILFVPLLMMLLAK